jgi:hypothetical protein
MSPRWHADVKPDNILLVKEEDITGVECEKFRLADPGFSKFERRGEGVPKTVLVGGTETYGESHYYLPQHLT